MVFRETAVSLVASHKDGTTQYHYALYRFIGCKLLESPVDATDDFSLDDVINSGSFDYADIEDKKIRLNVIFDPVAAKHISEPPLSDDQTMTKKRDVRIQVTATVKDTRQLKWWFLGFGDQVEVVKPKRLREEFIEIANNLI